MHVSNDSILERSLIESSLSIKARMNGETNLLIVGLKDTNSILIICIIKALLQDHGNVMYKYAQWRHDSSLSLITVIFLLLP